MNADAARLALARRLKTWTRWLDRSGFEDHKADAILAALLAASPETGRLPFER